MECGTYRGTSAHILLDTLALDRPFYLYDMFEAPERVLPEHGADLEGFVRQRFAPYPNVTITKGRVPETLSNAPDQIAFMHLDMNSAAAEIAALDVLFERMVPGAVLVLDDFGWQPYREQFVAESRWFAERGVPILEIPTGQALVIA